MVDVIGAFVDSLPTLASASVVGVSGYAFKKLKGWHGEHAELVTHLENSKTLEDKVEKLIALNEAQNAGLREVLGRELDKEHARLVAQGYASPAEKMAYERIYIAYHKVGGNGTRTALYEDVMRMNSYPSAD